MNYSNLKLSFAALSAAIVVITATSAKAGDTPTVSIPAASVDTGFYFEGFGGLLFLDDLSGRGSDSVHAEFDTGWIGGGTFGFELTSALSIEIEGASGQVDLEGLAINGQQLSQFDGDLSLTQAAVNLIYEFENSSNLTPYIGVGVGAAFVDVDFRSSAGNISDDDAGLYYQFIGGVSIELSPRTSIFAEYRYGSVQDLELQSGGGTVEFDDLTAHQAKFGIQIKF